MVEELGVMVDRSGDGTLLQVGTLTNRRAHDVANSSAVCSEIVFRRQPAVQQFLALQHSMFLLVRPTCTRHCTPSRIDIITC
jgi:hypothetical protein